MTTDACRLVSILIPFYNERPFLRRCVERVLAAPLPAGMERELILIDDGSTDGSGEIAEDLARRHAGVVRVVRQARNRGKGAAIRRAVAEMRGRYAVIQDADLEYDPIDLGALLHPLVDGHADVVYGSRFASQGMRRVLNYHHALANRFLTTVSNLCTGLNLTDMETGYKAFRVDVLKTIPVRSNRFGFEPEITAKIAKRRCIVYEVPVSYHGRSYDEGKKVRWTDGLAALLTILRYAIIDDCYEERYGHQILDDLSRAHHFNSWLVSTVQPALGQRILEIGSGIGNISRLLPRRERLTVSDMDPVYLDLLRSAFGDDDRVSVARIDLERDGDFAGLPGRGAYDTVVCMNVLEHVADDGGALRRMATALEVGGRLVLVVPQYAWLFGSYDRGISHHRRYGRRGLRRLLEASGYRVTRMRNFNCFSILGWWLSSCVLRRRSFGRLSIKVFDFLVPMFRLVEAAIPLPGLSLVVVAERLAKGASAR